MTADTLSAPSRGGSPSLQVPDYWWYRERAELLRIVFEPMLGERRSILDVGSADGPSVDWLANRGSRVPLDLDPRGLPPGGVCGSALALPFLDGSFDAITAFDVIEHCEPEHLVMSELARVLRPGGLLMIAVPAYQWAWTDHDVANGHHRRYTRRRLAAAIHGCGLEVVRSTHAFIGVFPLFTAERIARRARAAFIREAQQSAADIVAVPPVSASMDRLLGSLCRFDARFLADRNLPMGSSILAAATKPSGV